MAMITLGQTGPTFSLTLEELTILTKKRNLRFTGNDNITGEIQLTDKDPNAEELPNGIVIPIDPFSSDSYYISRYPDIFPHNTKKTIHYTLKAQRDQFLQDVEKYRRGKLELIGGRCRYDRFHVNILDF